MRTEIHFIYTRKDKKLNSLLAIGKYLDQPRLVGKFSNSVPALLTGSGTMVLMHNLYKTPDKDEKKVFIKDFSILAGTVASALIAVRGMKPLKIKGKTIFKGFEGLSERMDLKEIAENNTELINKFLKHNQVSEATKNILNKAKNKVLKLKEIRTLFDDLNKNKAGKDLLQELIPDPENVTSKEIFSEIKRLSLMGLVPVLGGIAGGIVGDRFTEKNWKDKIPNKIKEGAYQYLANIFLCNIGAGGALAILEKAKIKSKAPRALGMIGGILAVGVLGGSAIANEIGNKIINPLLGKKNKESLYDERTPEAIDLGLHLDDVASVAVLSGLKWIEPALPLLYSVSAYRAGIGYRNGHKKMTSINA